MQDDELLWKTVASESGPELPLFKVRFDRMRHPVTGTIRKALVLESPDWTNVVAVTPEGSVVMVEQFRFGSGAISLEPPSGIIEPGEESLAAAKRELLEETGFGGGQWRYLGAVQPNPAFHNNHCHHWLAEGVVPTQPQELDEGEAIRVRLMTPNELRDAVAAGDLQHTLAQSALARVFALWPLALSAAPDIGK
jgi:8-oxo-dGTP pyrophosphatase MutT (NUDIX family)